jgi:predicted metal-dependent TIM-barrel fold hydrolase
MKGYNEDKKPADKKPPAVKKPVEDTKQAQEGENRIDIYGTQGDKKRLIVKQDKTFNTIKSLLDKDGYIMTKQQEDLFNGNIVDYVKEQKKPARINIKPAKGKTDMMIISIEGHSFGQGAASIRIKKKEVKKEADKKPAVKKPAVKKVSVKKPPPVE